MTIPVRGRSTGITRDRLKWNLHTQVPWTFGERSCPNPKFTYHDRTEQNNGLIQIYFFFPLYNTPIMCFLGYLGMKCQHLLTQCHQNNLDKAQTCSDHLQKCHSLKALENRWEIQIILLVNTATCLEACS